MLSSNHLAGSDRGCGAILASLLYAQGGSGQGGEWPRPVSSEALTG